MESQVQWHVCPEQIRLDNGLEFVSHHMVAWGEEHNMKIDYIQPGKPAQNGCADLCSSKHSFCIDLLAYLC